MSTAITTARADTTAALMEQVVVNGDLASLSPQQRVTYYMRVCESLGLNPLTKPFDYIRLNGKLTLYTRKDATDQLRKLNNVSISIPIHWIFNWRISICCNYYRSRMENI
jgi:hypothetical protein